MNTMTGQTDRLGELVINRDGHVSGPRYGQVYTAPAGEKGYIAGVRNKAAGDQLYARVWRATVEEAEDYLVEKRAY